MSAASWIAVITLIVRLLVWADNQRIKAEGGKEANDAANTEARKRIALALAARNTPFDPGMSDPDRRD